MTLTSHTNTDTEREKRCPLVEGAIVAGSAAGFLRPYKTGGAGEQSCEKRAVV